jgi:hypothetical protein
MDSEGFLFRELGQQVLVIHIKWKHIISEFTDDRETRRPSSPAVVEPRRCTRFAKDTAYVSIIDKAKQRKKALNEGSGTPCTRRGELSVEDLLAVALEEARPLPEEDVCALASACDLPSSDLGLGVALPSTAASL